MEYRLYVHTDMVEIRTITAPDGMTPSELADYAEKNGYGDMVDVCDDMSELTRIETLGGSLVWGQDLRERAR